MPRRKFLKLTAGFAASLATTNVLAAKATGLSSIPLGLDAYSLRGMRWKAGRLIDYAAGLKLDTVLFNGLQYFERLDQAHLEDLKNQAASHGMRIYVGVGSVSRNSGRFRDTYGEPEQLIREGIRVATTLGSPVVNVRIGNLDDRYTAGGIEARIEECVTVLRASRNQALDAGIKFGFENHAGDLRSEELLGLIEAVGTDVCGVMLDPGNSVWAMEDPMKQVQMLGKYTVCTSIRDYVVWESETGATFQWTALGGGLMDVPAYAGYLAELCPGVPINVETISNEQILIPFLTDAHMKAYPDLKARDLIDFQKLCRSGHPIPVVGAPEGVDPKLFAQDQQRADFEQSIAYLREQCGVGRKVKP